MRKSCLLAVLVIFTMQLSAQKKINTVPINKLELNTPLSQYRSELFLITGNEDIYLENPNLRENVLQNIAKGIREGLYDGYDFSVVNKVRASRTTFFFYKEELYKVRWFFLKSDFPDLAEKSAQISAFFEATYGSGDEQIPDFLKVWETKKRYLQTFSEDTAFQIEYRDEKIHQVVESLKQ